MKNKKKDKMIQKFRNYMKQWIVKIKYIKMFTKFMLKNKIFNNYQFKI